MVMGPSKALGRSVTDVQSSRGGAMKWKRKNDMRTLKNRSRIYVHFSLLG